MGVLPQEGAVLSSPAPAPAQPKEPVIATYTCIKRALFHAGFDMDSTYLGVVQRETIIEAFEVKVNKNGVKRVRFAEIFAPNQLQRLGLRKGWMSEKTVGGAVILSENIE